MWKWILQAIQIASAINVRQSTILFVLELLKLFDRSLVKSVGQSNAKHTRKAGFVYVIRDKQNGERYKTGYRAKPPWRDVQLRADLGKSGDFVLIIPAKDASTLEKRLRQAYAKHSKKSDWFTLNKSERREILIIAALVMVAASDTLGMSPVDEEVVKLAKKLLAHLKGLASAMWANRASAQTQSSEEDEPSEAEDDFDEFSEIPDMDWNWESVLDRDYRRLPKLKGKEAYLSVFRDNNAKLGKVSFDDHPVKSIDVALAERWRLFPLEIVMILKVDNRRKARRALLSPSTDREKRDWVALSDDMLGEIKKLATAEWQGNSIYVGPKTHFGLETLPTEGFRDYPKLEETAGYVCVVQGVKHGKRRKIWSSRHPKRWTRYSWRARELNSPHELHTSSEPIRFKCVVRAAHAQSYKSFLHKRYRQQRRKGRWFELDDAQLEEIRNMGRKRR